MIDKDTITLPREVVEFVLQVLEKGVTFKPGWVPECEDATATLHNYLAAPRPEPLTDEEALRLWAGDAPRPVMGKNKVLAFTRAIERAHNIKGDKT